MTYKSSASETLKTIRIQAAARQAKWREKQKEAGIVERTFVIAERDAETFKNLAATSRNAASVANIRNMEDGEK
jgi:hypothetical protein